MIQFRYWTELNNPALEILQVAFKAFSEERGEISIHDLMTHLKDWNFQGSRLDLFYKETCVSGEAFRILNITSRSHKDGKPKSFPLNPPFREAGDSVCDRLSFIQYQVSTSRFVPFQVTSHQITWDSPLSAGTHHWTELWKVILRRNILAAKAFEGLLVKFEAPLDFFETEQEIDPDLLYW